jgi:hypothetical protein
MASGFQEKKRLPSSFFLSARAVVFVSHAPYIYFFRMGYRLVAKTCALRSSVSSLPGWRWLLPPSLTHPFWQRQAPRSPLLQVRLNLLAFCR